MQKKVDILTVESLLEELLLLLFDEGMQGFDEALVVSQRFRGVLFIVNRKLIILIILKILRLKA